MSGQRWRVSPQVWRWGKVAFLAVLVWAAARLPWAAMLAALARVSWPMLLVLAALNAGFLALSVARWAVLLRAAGAPRVPWRLLWQYRLAGFAVSYFTPGTQFGGEPLQVAALHHRAGVPAAAAWAAVGLDRLLDLSTNVAFLALALTWVVLGGVHHQGWDLHTAVAAVLAPLAVVAAGWLGLCVKAWPVQGSGWRAALGRAARLCRGNPRALLAGLGLSLAAWAVLLVEYHMMLRALGLRSTAAQTVGMMLAARLAFLTPLPGAAGALEAAQALAATWMGWPATYGLALGLLIRARDGLIGGLGLWFAHRVWPALPSSTTTSSVPYGGLS